MTMEQIKALEEQYNGFEGDFFDCRKPTENQRLQMTNNCPLS
jgi:hypothetical protein